jgi:nitrate reductase NapE component
VSGTGRAPGHGPGPMGPRTSRWRDPDWWFGRTPEQLDRREKAREEFRTAREDLKQTWHESTSTESAAQQSRARSVGGRIGEIGKVLTIAVTLPILAAAFFGPVGFVVVAVVAVLLLVGRNKHL